MNDDVTCGRERADNSLDTREDTQRIQCLFVLGVGAFRDLDIEIETSQRLIRKSSTRYVPTRWRDELDGDCRKLALLFEYFGGEVGEALRGKGRRFL